MIWISKDRDNDIIFFTSDNKKFYNLVDATNYVSVEYTKLESLKDSFEIGIDRRKKINKILQSIKNIVK